MSSFKSKSKDKSFKIKNIKDFTRRRKKDLKEITEKRQSYDPKTIKIMKEFVKKYLPENWDIWGNGFIDEWKELYDNDWWMGEYAEMEGISDEEAEEVMKSNYTELIKEYALIPSEKEIFLYRGLDEEEFEKIIWNKLGEHWTTDKNVASIKFALGGGRKGIVLTIKVKKGSIDWKETLIQNVGQYSTESEITMKENQKVFIEKVEKVQEEGESYTYKVIETQIKNNEGII